MNQILILIPDKLKKPMGGMGEQLRNLAAHTPSDYHLTIIGSANSEEYSEERFDYYAHHNLSTMWSKENYKMVDQVFLKQSLFVQRALSLDVKPDIVHAFDWSTMWAGRIIARHYKVPLVTTIQLSIDANTPSHVKATELEYDLAASIELSGMIDSASIIQVSENYASLFPKFLLPKTTVIHNGIDLSLWKKDIDIKLVGNGRRKIVYIGRFAKMKNVDALLDLELPEDTDLIFIGSPNGGHIDIYNRMLKACSEKDNFHYAGARYGQEKIDWLMAADAVIVPSTHEPFGIVGLEGLASRSIVLSSFVNGMGDYLTDECAINCGTTTESISKAIDRFASMTNEEKNKMKSNGLKVCRDHDWSIQADKLFKVYNENIKLSENV